MRTHPRTVEYRPVDTVADREATFLFTHHARKLQNTRQRICLVIRNAIPTPDLADTTPERRRDPLHFSTAGSARTRGCRRSLAPTSSETVRRTDDLPRHQRCPGYRVGGFGNCLAETLGHIRVSRPSSRARAAARTLRSPCPPPVERPRRE